MLRKNVLHDMSMNIGEMSLDSDGLNAGRWNDKS